MRDHSGVRMPILLSIAELRFERDWSRSAHIHPDYHEMLVVTGGAMEVITQGRVLAGNVGSAFVYRQGVEHQEHIVGEQPLTMFWLIWQRPTFPDEPPWPLQSADCQGRLLWLLHWMRDIFMPRNVQDQNMLSALMYAVLYEYTHGQRNPEDEMFQSIRRHVKEHLAEPLSLADLAEVACMSKYHFAHVFHRVVGETPMAFVRKTRIEAARTLLLTSRLPLRVIADMVGFRDEFHLSRIIKRSTGHAPGELRSKRQER